MSKAFPPELTPCRCSRNSAHYLAESEPAWVDSPLMERGHGGWLCFGRMAARGKKQIDSLRLSLGSGSLVYKAPLGGPVGDCVRHGLWGLQKHPHPRSLIPAWTLGML